MESPGTGGLPEGISRADFLRTVRRRAAIAVLAFGAGLSIDWVWARLVRGFRLQREQYRRFVVGGYRIHHNVVGYAALVAGVFVYPWLLLPLGLGMLVGHRRRDRLWWFVERVR